jgi:hypothetical protein
MIEDGAKATSSSNEIALSDSSGTVNKKQNSKPTSASTKKQSKSKK